jgi:hypothetical protein
MSMAEFNNMMTHKVTLRKRKRNTQGDFSDISSSQLPGFVEWNKMQSTDKLGEDVMIKGIVYLQDDCGIDITHDYWMIDQTSPQIRLNLEVVNILSIDDPRTGKTHHYELEFK